MKRVLVGLIMGLWLLATGTASAQTPTSAELQIGVVISLHGQVKTYCVSVPPSATGLDALEATGVDVLAQRGPLGAGICRVQNTGCTPPTDTCFCQCQGSQCNYWAYHYQEQNKWVYSGLGASNRKLQQGSLEGWLWSEGTGQTPSSQLPTLSFDAICKATTTATTEPIKVISNADPVTVLGYVVFGGVLLAGAFIWWRRSNA